MVDTIIHKEDSQEESVSKTSAHNLPRRPRAPIRDKSQGRGEFHGEKYTAPAESERIKMMHSLQSLLDTCAAFLEEGANNTKKIEMSNLQLAEVLTQRIGSISERIKMMHENQEINGLVDTRAFSLNTVLVNANSIPLSVEILLSRAEAVYDWLSTGTVPAGVFPEEKPERQKRTYNKKANKAVKKSAKKGPGRPPVKVGRGAKKGVKRGPYKTNAKV